MLLTVLSWGENAPLWADPGEAGRMAMLQHVTEGGAAPVPRARVPRRVRLQPQIDSPY